MFLLEIYKKLSLHEDTDAMNEVLDLFDEYIYPGQSELSEGYGFTIDHNSSHFAFVV